MKQVRVKAAGGNRRRTQQRDVAHDALRYLGLLTSSATFEDIGIDTAS